MIAIVNYGLGNIGSIKNMLKRIGVEAETIANPSDLAKASKIILPGVGAFDTGMQYLTDHGWIEKLNQKVLVEKIPTLGICLGMQLMTQRSEEGLLPGLGWVDGEVVRFPSSSLKVPHMGWNVVNVENTDKSIFANEGAPELRFYFVHSYYVSLANPTYQLGETSYGQKFTSAFHKGNIYGVQFHPEKSHKFGMRLLKNFASL
jgi:imidazole glycerol-phosphate synthase subunit HisH